MENVKRIKKVHSPY